MELIIVLVIVVVFVLFVRGGKSTPIKPDCVSEDTLDCMSKDELEAYAKKNFSVDLDKRRRRSTLIEQIIELQENK